MFIAKHNEGVFIIFLILNGWFFFYSYQIYTFLPFHLPALGKKKKLPLTQGDINLLHSYITAVVKLFYLRHFDGGN